MGLSLSSVLMIATNEDVRVSYYKKDDKFGFAIEFWKRGSFHTVIASTEPFYSSKVDAKREAEMVICDCKRYINDKFENKG